MAVAALLLLLGYKEATVLMTQFKHYICIPKAVQNEETHLFGFVLFFARLWKCTDIMVKAFSRLSCLRYFVTRTRNSNSLNTYLAFLLDFLVIVI